MMVELNATTFGTVIERGAVLVSWYRRGWAPWRAFAPIYQDAAHRHPRIVFARVDAETEHVLAARCGITAIPTLMAFRDGTLVQVRVGFDVAESLDVLVHRISRPDRRPGPVSPEKCAEAHGAPCESRERFRVATRVHVWHANASGLAYRRGSTSSCHCALVGVAKSHDQVACPRFGSAGVIESAGIAANTHWLTSSGAVVWELSSLGSVTRPVFASTAKVTVTRPAAVGVFASTLL